MRQVDAVLIVSYMLSWCWGQQLICQLGWAVGQR